MVGNKAICRDAASIVDEEGQLTMVYSNGGIGNASCLFMVLS